MTPRSLFSFPLFTVHRSLFSLLLFTVHCSLLTSLLAAPPDIRWDVETSTLNGPTIEIRRGETVTLTPRFLDHATVLPLTNSETCALYYRSADMTAGLYYAITGTIHNTTGGQARVTWTGANCPVATNLQADFVILSAGVTNLRAYLNIRLQNSVYGSATTATNPTIWRIIDWSSTSNLNTSAGPWISNTDGATNALDIALRALVTASTQTIAGASVVGTVPAAQSAYQSTYATGLNHLLAGKTYDMITNDSFQAIYSFLFNAEPANPVQMAVEAQTAVSAQNAASSDYATTAGSATEAGHAADSDKLANLTATTYLTNKQPNAILGGTLTPTNTLTVTNSLQLANIAAASYLTNNHANASLSGTLAVTNLTVRGTQTNLAGIYAGTLTLTTQAITFAETADDNIGLESVTYPIGNAQTNSAWLGYAALRQSPGALNSAVGLSALREAPGSLNSAVGSAALYQSTGSLNSAVGYASLYQAPGSQNSALGYAALRQSPGSYNSAVGSSALYQSTGSYNFAGGYQSGYRSGGTSNLFLGANAAYTATGTNYYTNAICVGAGSVPLGNNSMTLGNAQTATTEINGNVGLGTNAPAAKLDVNGDAIIRTNLTVSQVIYFKTNTVVTAPAAGFGGIYIDATTNYWFWHPNAGGTGPGWTNKLW